MKVLGLHHITAIARGAQTNLLFYTRVLGLRLVKRTVNFDAPDTYHLYYGNELGSPGSLLTFFPFQDAAPGRAGTGMTQTTAFTVPEVGFESWMHRLAEGGHDFEGPFRRFGALMLAIRDPDGLRVELVAESGSDDGEAGNVTHRRFGDVVRADTAIRHIYSVTLCVEAFDRTSELLTQTFGYEARHDEAQSVPGRYRRALPNLVDGTGERGFQEHRAAGNGNAHALQSNGQRHSPVAIFLKSTQRFEPNDPEWITDFNNSLPPDHRI